MPKSAGSVLGWMFTTGAASVDCTRSGSIRTHNVSATLEVAGPVGVSDGVAEGVGDVGSVLTDTSGGALGASSWPWPPQPASSTAASPAIRPRRIRMMTRSLPSGAKLPFPNGVFVGAGVVPPELAQPDRRCYHAGDAQHAAAEERGPGAGEGRGPAAGEIRARPGAALPAARAERVAEPPHARQSAAHLVRDRPVPDHRAAQ